MDALHGVHLPRDYFAPHSSTPRWSDHRNRPRDVSSTPSEGAATGPSKQPRRRCDRFRRGRVAAARHARRRCGPGTALPVGSGSSCLDGRSTRWPHCSFGPIASTWATSVRAASGRRGEPPSFSLPRGLGCTTLRLLDLARSGRINESTDGDRADAVAVSISSSSAASGLAVRRAVNARVSFGRAGACRYGARVS